MTFFSSSHQLSRPGGQALTHCKWNEQSGSQIEKVKIGASLLEGSQC